MSKLHLHPLAARLRWYFPAAMPVEDWQVLLEDYLTAVARDCRDSGQVVIGHIKGLFLLPGDGFLRASAVSADHPVDSEISAGASSVFEELTLTVNVIVYGLPADRGKEIVVENAKNVAATRKGHIAIENVSEEGSHHAHDHA